MNLLVTCICAIFLTAATLKNDKIYNNLAESVRVYTEIHKLMKIMELFSCESSMNQFLNIAKFLMPKGFYCNINLIDERSNIEMRLSSIKNEHPQRRTLMIVDTACISGGNLLNMASLLEMFNGHYHWILVEVFTQQYESIIELLSVLNISVSSEITLFSIQQQQPLLLLLYDVWNPSYHHGGRLIVTELGNYTDVNGLQFHGDFHKQISAGVIKRRMNMQGIRLKVMCVIQEQLREPFEQLLYESYEPWKDPITRFTFSLLEIIREMFNLTYTLGHTKSWGYLQDDGTFDGMIGALIRKEADVGGTALFFRLERLQFISLTAESWNHRTCFIFQQPGYSATIQNPFLKPLDANVWIILGIFGLVFAFTLNLVEVSYECVKQMKVKHHNITHKNQIINQSHKSQQQNIKKHRNVMKRDKNVAKCCYKSQCNDTKKKRQKARKRVISLRLSQNQQSRNFYAAEVRIFNQLFNGLLIFISALAQQGVLITNHKSSTALKITVSIMMIFGFLIYQFYSGSIVSSIFDAKHETIKTLEDLTNSDLELGMEDAVYDRDIFKHSKDPVIQRLYHKKIEFYNKTTRSFEYKFYTPEHGIEMVRTKAFAFHIQEATAYKIIQQNFDEKLICKLSEINGYRPQVLVGSLQKNSTFRELFSYGTRRLKEVGIMDRWRKIFHLPKPKCARNLQTSDFQIDMTAVYPLLILLSGGFSLGFMALIVENFIFHRVGSQKPRKKLKQTQFIYLE